MVGIGAALNRRTLLLFLKNPKAFIFGVSLQVLLMPRKYNKVDYVILRLMR